jgi:hypothetical protein
MNRILGTACFLLLSFAASAETYNECIERVLAEQAKCEVPCSKSEDSCRKCNEGVSRMQKRCEDRAKEGPAKSLMK